jgi:hypothetical protein
MSGRSGRIVDQVFDLREGDEIEDIVTNRNRGKGDGFSTA